MGRIGKGGLSGGHQGVQERGVCFGDLKMAMPAVVALGARGIVNRHFNVSVHARHFVNSNHGMVAVHGVMESELRSAAHT